MHARNDAHARRAFRYPVYVASIDLDELPALHRELRLFSHGRWNLFSLDDRDYSTGAGGLRAGHARLLAEHDLPAPAAARLVTNLKVLGYGFNPVSFFLGYDAAGALTSVVAEVNNTYGGRYCYVLGPAQRIGGPGRASGFATGASCSCRHSCTGARSYEFWFDAPLDGASLAIRMNVDTPDGDRVLVARLDGERRPLRDRALAAAAARYPLMTAQVIGLIHYEALKLYLRGVPYRRPGPDHRPLEELPEEPPEELPEVPSRAALLQRPMTGRAGRR